MVLPEKPDKNWPMKSEQHFNEAKAHSDGDFVIKINPWAIFKVILVIVVLAGVFYLGRFSTTLSDDLGFLGFSKDSGATPTAATVKDSEQNNSVEDADLQPAESSEEEVVAEEVVEEPVELSANASESEPVANESSVEKEEVIVTTYNDVSLAIDGVLKQWKETWGKMTGIEYSIKNSEAGTIKPHHFIMIVEGYEDINKKFNVAYTSQSVKAGETLKDSSAITDGFAYSKINTGDLTNVRIVLQLYDSSNKLIAATNREVDLSG